MKLLIVDDDIYSISGLKNGVNWEKTGITQVYEATHVNQAKNIFLSENIDILLCDIEMPGKSGIELLEWIVENEIRTVTIFYSCHADFVYAQKALALKAFNYILKPSPYDEIEQVLKEAVMKAEADHEAAIRDNKYRVWNLDKYEKFYLSCMDGTIPNHREEIERTSLLWNIEQGIDTKMALVVFQVEDWDHVLGIMNRFDVNFCIKNMAGELFTDPGIQKKFAFPYQKRLYAVIVVYSDDSQTLDNEFFENRCTRLANSFYKLFQSKLKYKYISSLTIEELNSIMEQFIYGLEIQREKEATSGLSAQADRIAYIMDLKEWKDCLIHNNGELLNQQVEEYFARVSGNGGADYYFIETLYHEYSHLILQILDAKKIEARNIMDSLEYKRIQPEARWSVGNLKKYIHLVNRLVLKALEQKDEPELIDQIKQYIELHIDEELSREKIAEEVFINPDYLSRMFRKKTGFALNQYINERKIEKVKELLDLPGMSISEAASRTGYLNFSYFCQVFKRVTGETPSCYCSKKGKKGNNQKSE